MKVAEQTVKATCPECGHEQLVDLKYANGSEMIRDVFIMLGDSEVGAVFDGFKCACGKYVEVLLLNIARSVRQFD